MEKQHAMALDQHQGQHAVDYVIGSHAAVPVLGIQIPQCNTYALVIKERGTVLLALPIRRSKKGEYVSRRKALFQKALRLFDRVFPLRPFRMGLMLPTMDATHCPLYRSASREAGWRPKRPFRFWPSMKNTADFFSTESTLSMSSVLPPT